MSENRVVQSLWVGKRLPLMQQISVASFLAAGHEYHLYAYDSVAEVPSGARVLDASAIVSPSRIARDPGQRGYAGFSDLFRYEMLLRNGGWWVDTDFICLRPFDFDSAYVFSSEYGGEGAATVNTGAIKCPAGAPILEYLCDTSSQKDLHSIRWCEIGPALIAKAVREFRLDEFAQPPEVFCPVCWFHFQKLFASDGIGSLPASTYAVHLWNAMWGAHDYDPDGAFHPDSAYESWKLTYLDGHV